MSRKKVSTLTAEEESVIYQAKAILRRQIKGSQYDITGPRTVADYVQLMIGTETREIMYAIYLDNRHRVIGDEPIFFGGLTECQVDVRVLLRHALGHGATALIIGHNHPSGSLTASQADIAITTRIKAGCEAVGITLLDHVIVSTQGISSLAEQGVGGL